jgi:ketosteroid isomerase-like protein
MAHSEDPSPQRSLVDWVLAFWGVRASSREETMQNQSATTVRTAYEAYARGDLPTMLGFIDPELEWTFLDPSFEDPEPQVCHGRQELHTALERQAQRGLTSELEDVIANWDRVVGVVRTPGVDAYRARKADDRNYDVLTVNEGKIVPIHACRDREEALRGAGLG